MIISLPRHGDDHDGHRFADNPAAARIVPLAAGRDESNALRKTRRDLSRHEALPRLLSNCALRADPASENEFGNFARLLRTMAGKRLSDGGCSGGGQQYCR